MPFKNPGKYFFPCLESIQKQSHQNWELIGVNDSSSDGSEEVFKHFFTQDSRFVFIQNNGQGIVDALITGERHVKGDFICRMDADDLMPTDKLETLVAICQDDVVATGKIAYFSDDWLVGPGFRRYEHWINKCLSNKTFDAELFKECLLPSTAWLMTLKTFQEIGGFYTDILPEDYDLFFRTIVHRLEYKVCNKVVHHWRDHPGRTSRKDERYFPKSYFLIKWKYFHQIKFLKDKKLVLWGAGNKGKAIAQLLIKNKVAFSWLSNNPNKIGHNIYGTVVKPVLPFRWESSQVIVAISSPKEQKEVQIYLNEKKRVEGKNWWFFG